MLGYRSVTATRFEMPEIPEGYFREFIVDAEDRAITGSRQEFI
jgi:hypothetical protein